MASSRKSGAKRRLLGTREDRNKKSRADPEWLENHTVTCKKRRKSSDDDAIAKLSKDDVEIKHRKFVSDDTTEPEVFACIDEIHEQCKIEQAVLTGLSLMNEDPSGTISVKKDLECGNKRMILRFGSIFGSIFASPINSLQQIIKHCEIDQLRLESRELSVGFCAAFKKALANSKIKDVGENSDYDRNALMKQRHEMTMLELNIEQSKRERSQIWLKDLDAPSRDPGSQINFMICGRLYAGKSHQFYCGFSLDCETMKKRVKEELEELGGDPMAIISSKEFSIGDYISFKLSCEHDNFRFDPADGHRLEINDEFTIKSKHDISYFTLQETEPHDECDLKIRAELYKNENMIKYCPFFYHWLSSRTSRTDRVIMPPVIQHISNQVICGDVSNTGKYINQGSSSMKVEEKDCTSTIFSSSTSEKKC